MFLRLFPRNEEYTRGSDVPRGMRVGALPLKRGKVLDRLWKSLSVPHISGKRLPVQRVDATPFNQLIRQYFPLENRSVRLYSIRPSQGGVPFASTLVNDF
jgi:hypothetical protein